ncbi:hypothetical protein GGD65_002523 [Bradyrhizobium sp. CIR18]|nr:hypothetical protein [Bradyrhizobium sp. CIR18]
MLINPFRRSRSESPFQTRVMCANSAVQPPAK